jgi:hypothetical protein
MAGITHFCPVSKVKNTLSCIMKGPPVFPKRQQGTFTSKPFNRIYSDRDQELNVGM